MPRIIFKCPYIKPRTGGAAAHLSNYVRYVATRDGVEKLTPDKAGLPATKKQRAAEVLRTYKDDLPQRLPLSRQNEFKRIKNLVIEEAVRLGGEYNEILSPEDAVESTDHGDIQRVIHLHQKAEQGVPQNSDAAAGWDHPRGQQAPTENQREEDRHGLQAR